MLIEFTVGNFRSFRDRQTFSMEATKLQSPPSHKDLDTDNLFSLPLLPKGAKPKVTLLRSSAIYGANASGKSNLVKAMQFMREFVMRSSRESQAGERINVEPFLLDPKTESAPSFFEMCFISYGRRFRYGFEVNNRRVLSEWLFSGGVRETELFTRREQDIKSKSRSFRGSNGLDKRTRDNALFLSVAAQFNVPAAMQVLVWFAQLNLVSGLNDHEYLTAAMQAMENPEHRVELVQFVRLLDVGIQDINVEQRPLVEELSFLPKEALEQYGDRTIPVLGTMHAKLDSAGQKVGNVRFSLGGQESNGTQKLFYLAGTILKALREGSTLFMDELDARLHPKMTREIIKIFHGSESNPLGAQLIFTTHDTNLLSHQLLRRDQIWFAEKDDSQGTHLYSLAEFQLEDGSKVRSNGNFEEDYIRGKFGAIPFLGDLKRVVAEATARSANNALGASATAEAAGEEDGGQSQQNAEVEA